MRTIDADPMKADFLTFDSLCETMIQWCIVVLIAQQTIKSERKKWEWIVGGIEEEEGHLSSRWYECNLCHTPGDRQDNFCRGCGADMRGEQDG